MSCLFLKTCSLLLWYSSKYCSQTWNSWRLHLHAENDWYSGMSSRRLWGCLLVLGKGYTSSVSYAIVNKESNIKQIWNWPWPCSFSTNLLDSCYNKVSTYMHNKYEKVISLFHFFYPVYTFVSGLVTKLQKRNPPLQIQIKAYLPLTPWKNILKGVQRKQAWIHHACPVWNLMWKVLSPAEWPGGFQKRPI